MNGPFKQRIHYVAQCDEHNSEPWQRRLKKIHEIKCLSRSSFQKLSVW